VSTAMVGKWGKAVPPVVSPVHEIPLEKIRESASNPRRAFDDGQLRELAANIQSPPSCREFLCPHRLIVRRVYRNWWLAHVPDLYCSGSSRDSAENKQT